tara:strand:+ start:57 stop:707 length:651 start_codon:yes stop_codon:yes gene_type:complete
MNDLQDSVPCDMFTPSEIEENGLLTDLMKAIGAPVDYDIDYLTKVVELLGNRQQLRMLLHEYVDKITLNTRWSYDQIRKELQAFADACEPPISHMQARTLAYIEKRKRAKKGDALAGANLLSHERRHWRLNPEIEDHLWSWISKRWQIRENAATKHDNLLQELTTLSELLHVPREVIYTWVRAVITNIAKMIKGGIKIKGISVRAVVRAATDDTAP